jgi:hypothetical protein
MNAHIAARGRAAAGSRDVVGAGELMIFSK